MNPTTVTIIISSSTLLVAIYNVILSLRRFRLDSYVFLATERIKELESSIIRYSTLIKRYNHIWFTIQEQKDNKKQDYSVKELNVLILEKEETESKIRFLIEGKKDALEILKKINEINSLEYNLPSYFNKGNGDKAHKLLNEPCNQMLETSRRYIDNELKKIKEFKFKHL